MHDAVQRAVSGVVTEGGTAACGVRDHRTQREHVDRTCQLPCPRSLFGRHVGGRAHHHAGPGELTLVRGPGGDAEVYEGEAVEGQHDVGRLEVPPLPLPLIEALVLGPVMGVARRWLSGIDDVDWDEAARILPDRIWRSLIP